MSNVDGPEGRRMGAAAGVADFAVTLPENWMLLDVTGSVRIPTELAELLERGARVDPAFASHRGVLERQLREVIRRVRGEELSLAAVHATVIADVLPLTATLTIAVRGGYEGVDAAADLMAFHRSRPGHVAELVVLAEAGPAVHVRYRDTVADPQAGVQVSAEVFQYLVPVPGRTGLAAVLTFATPATHPDLVASFADLFAAIADSFAFVPGGAGHAGSSAEGER